MGTHGTCLGTTTWCSTPAGSATTRRSKRSWPPCRAAPNANVAQVIHSLGSRTSGVDGSSEGGRINTNDLPGALVIYGVALVQRLQAEGVKAKLTVAPVKVDGVWCLELTYQGDAPTGVPSTWHGHRVILKAAEPPPPPPPPPRA